MNHKTNVFLAGHNGMVGSAINKILKSTSVMNLITVNRNKLNLEDALETSNFFASNQIDIIINAAAKVGGIVANDKYPYDFIMSNLLIQNNLIEAAVKHKMKKFIFLGSSCIYPKFAPQPIKEEYLLSGYLEPTNQWYAIAKITGIMSCLAAKKQFGLNTICLMPTNLYGENDNFDLSTSHVLPAMIRKFHDAKINKHSTVSLWGSGLPYREFLNVNDFAEAAIFALGEGLSEDIYNVGYGTDIRIKDLALIIQDITGHKGEIIWDKTKPDGTPKKLLESSKIKKAGWSPKTELNNGIKETYNWFLKNEESIRELNFNK